MSSTGNDIVALMCGNAGRAAQERFYSKIVTQPELDLYCGKKFSALPFDSYVWLLWSIKEAVYKYQKRNNPSLLFSPKKITVQHIELPLRHGTANFGDAEFERISTNGADCYTCQIMFGDKVLYAKSRVYDELVHTVVNNTQDFSNIWWGLKRVQDAGYEAQSKGVRCLVLNTLAGIFPNDNLKIVKNGIGYPEVVKNDKPLPLLPLSFAHHENFVGYSFLLQ